jgi:hypothetical protein
MSSYKIKSKKSKEKRTYQTDEEYFEDILKDLKLFQTFKKEGIEIRFKPREKGEYGTTDIDFEYDDKNMEVSKVIPVITIFGKRNRIEDIKTIRHEYTHVNQFKKTLIIPLRKKAEKKTLKLNEAELYVDKVLFKSEKSKLKFEEEAYKSQ